MFLQPVLSSSLQKSSSCTSLDSGKESACDDQLLRPDHLPDQCSEKLTLCLKESSPHSPDSGASGSSESPPTEAALVSGTSALSHPMRQHSQPASAAAVIAGLRHATHSIDEALSAAQCIATAVFVKDEDNGGVSGASAVSEHCPGTQGSLSEESCLLEGVCDIRQKQTPDLVLDLPLRLNAETKFTSGSNSMGSSADQEDDSQASSSPSGPESPDMTTAAERFAKQNQCTLKKNTKASHSLGSPLDSKPSSALHNSPRHSKSVECHSEKDSVKPTEVAYPGQSLSKHSSTSAALPCAPGQDQSSDKKPSVSSLKPPIKVKPQIMKKPIVPPSQPTLSSVPTPKDDSNLNDAGSNNAP